MKNFKLLYRSDEMSSFFQTLLIDALKYRRCVGFFSSSAFHSWGLFIMKLFSEKHDFKVELLISPNLNDRDIKALKNGLCNQEELKNLYESEIDKLLDSMLSSGESSYDDFSLILSWLICFKKIDLKIAFPVDGRDHSIYHTKIGYVEYPDGKIVFSGSANETLSGHHHNTELVTVFTENDPKLNEAYNDLKDAIDKDWSGDVSSGYTVERLTQKNLAKLRLLSEPLPKNFTTQDIEVNDGKVRFRRLPCKKKQNIKLRSHQSDAVYQWAENNYYGIFSMCTGAGKTIAALSAVKKLDIDKDLTSVVIICPTNVLVNQWRDEVINFLLDDYSFQKPLDSENDKFNEEIRYWLGKRISKIAPNIIITTNASFVLEPMQAAVRYHARTNNIRTLLIADEVHTCGAKIIRSTLNNDVVSQFFTWRLGMSATYEREDDPLGTKFLTDYFGNVVAEFSLKDGIYGTDPCLCEYYYYPIIKRLDGNESASFWRLKEDKSKNKKDDYITQRNASIKALPQIFGEQGPIQSSVDALRTVCFTPMGSDEDGNLLERAVNKIRSLIPNVRVTNVEKSGETRFSNIEKFRSGYFQILVAMKIFDEGVNIPEIENAVMMYSYDRERQFIQRRGRVLRKCAVTGKTHADIYDIILIPESGMTSGQKDGLLQKEMRRYLNFCETAKNGAEAKEFIEKAYMEA